jgi:hypothetical protein
VSKDHRDDDLFTQLGNLGWQITGGFLSLILIVLAIAALIAVPIFLLSTQPLLGAAAIALIVVVLVVRLDRQAKDKASLMAMRAEGEVRDAQFNAEFDARLAKQEADRAGKEAEAQARKRAEALERERVEEWTRQRDLSTQRLTRYSGPHVRMPERGSAEGFVVSLNDKARLFNLLLLGGTKEAARGAAETIAAAAGREVLEMAVASAAGADVAELLVGPRENCLLFIPDLDSPTDIVDYVLRPMLHDRTLPITVGEGVTSKVVTLNLKPFSVVAHSGTGEVPAPLTDWDAILAFGSQADRLVSAQSVQNDTPGMDHSVDLIRRGLAWHLEDPTGTEFVIFERGDTFVQFVGDSDSLHGEVEGNEYRDEATQLSGQQIAQLHAMGWLGPDEEFGGNFYREWDLPTDLGAVASIVVQAFADCGVTFGPVSTRSAG